MNNEYQKNQAKQKNLLKKYKKTFRNMLLGGIIGISSFFLFPYIGLADVLPPTLFVGTRIGITTAGFITALYNGIKSHHISKKLKNEMDYEEGLVESMELSSNKKDEKIKELDNALHLEKQKNNVTNIERTSFETKDIPIDEYDEINSHIKSLKK